MSQDDESRESTTLGIVDRYLAGDDQAFEELVHRYWGKVLGHVMYLMGVDLRRRFDPEDVAQEVWLEVHKTLPRSPPRISFGSWIRTITQRLISKMSKDRSVPWKSSSPHPDEESTSRAMEFTASMTSPSRSNDRRESIERLVKEVEKLPGVEREAWTLNKFEEKSLAEIAEILELTPMAVAQRIKRANERLRKILDDRDASDPASWR